MSTRNATRGYPYLRIPTRHRGISYRPRADGTRQYTVCFQGRYIGVEGGEREALAKQAELRGKAARGERPVTSTRATFAEVAEQWLASKRHLRPWTRKNYRAALDLVLIPRFGQMRLTAITPEHIARLIRELEREGPSGKPLSSSMIDGYLRPLNGAMTFALRRGLITVNPCTLLTSDDRPHRRERRQDHVWSDEEIEALIEAAEELARKPASRYDYTPLLRTALFTGLRLGELLGLQWQDVDLHEGVIHVRRQHTRLGEYAPPKTKAALRRIPLSERDDKRADGAQAPLALLERRRSGVRRPQRQAAQAPQRHPPRLRARRREGRHRGRHVPLDAARVRLTDDRPRHLLDRARRVDGARVEHDHRAPLRASV